MEPSSNFYSDWQFWSAIAAFLALALTQLPPVRLWFKGRKPEVDVHARVGVTHWLGNPQLGMYLTLRNDGPHVLNITGINVKVMREGEVILEAPAQQYYETLSSTQPALFVPFRLKPDNDWGHTVYFFKPFDRVLERQIRRDTSAMAQDIQQKLQARPEGNVQPVEADQRLVQPFDELFNRLFRWNPGEYTIELQVLTPRKSSSFKQTYRFTIFESDTDDLRRFSETYKYGAGVSFASDKQVPAWIPIQTAP